VVDEAAIADTRAPRISVASQAPRPDVRVINSEASSQLPPPTSALGHVSSTGSFIDVDRAAASSDTGRDPQSRSSPEPSQTDQEGHYVGPSSGASFLLRIQKRLHQNRSFSQDSSIFTFGDAPLPEFDPSFFVMPPKADAQRLVERYFDFACPTHRFLHRPTIESMVKEFYETMGDMRSKEDAPARTALLLIVFAQAQAHMPPEIGADTKDIR
jgi:hypothetical protein